ncbi:MAG: nucleoside monophosphate kinase [Candidatus Kaiserbacteria bacterium]|nr:nucleoside monophosphate kinase [Candidatus Kaiserbacteria bacterium]
MQSYLFFGPPGSGKGTQKGMLADALGGEESDSVAVIETGQLLRDFMEEKDTLIKKCLADIMESGGLVPSAFPISTWINALTDKAGHYEHIIVDGAGRKLVEAKIIVEFLQFFPDSTIHVVYLDVHDDEVLERLLKRGRVDDKEDVIKNRLKVYKDAETGTVASINFLRGSNEVTFHPVDGVGAIEVVHRRVCDTLGV